MRHVLVLAVLGLVVAIAPPVAADETLSCGEPTNPCVDVNPWVEYVLMQEWDQFVKPAWTLVDEYHDACAAAGCRLGILLGVKQVPRYDTGGPMCDELECRVAVDGIGWLTGGASPFTIQCDPGSMRAGVTTEMCTRAQTGPRTYHIIVVGPGTCGPVTYHQDVIVSFLATGETIVGRASATVSVCNPG
ncbi:MAG TPA: hypothetical protein VM889_12665 [Candidatus Thermoplasmatota archaeon]|nr:hypothetical protein [Candidatus Thermoplasmatota archaeon]